MRWVLIFAVVVAGSASGARSTIRPAITANECRKPVDARSRACARAVDTIAKRFPRSAYQKTCFDFSEYFREGFHVLPVSPTHVLIEARCSSGAYNTANLYFLFDGESAKLVLFPVESAALASREIREKWQLESFDAVVFAREFIETRMVALRKGIGDGSLGYYTEYTFDRTTGLPELKYTATRILEDHEQGYNFESGVRPSGAGWISFIPKPNATGKLIEFK